MTPPSPAPEARIAACSIRLLGVHLDAADAATGQSVAAAVERLADELVTWHDAVVLGNADHVVGPHRALRSLPRAVPPRELTTSALERISVSAQTVARDLGGVAGEVGRHADAVAGERLGAASSTAEAEKLAERGHAIAHTVQALAETVAELGVTAGRERRREHVDPARAALAVHRAEQTVRRAAEASGRRT